MAEAYKSLNEKADQICAEKFGANSNSIVNTSYCSKRKKLKESIQIKKECSFESNVTVHTNDNGNNNDTNSNDNGNDNDKDEEMKDQDSISCKKENTSDYWCEESFANLNAIAKDNETIGRGKIVVQLV
ncbi:protein kinase, Atypical group [Reticulomyxa filosa]|uniref:Protein kinase, Atypical group n=1 Tax=Reticulomyxa filosa TaxID=46433 RepID=X6NTH3_RETFI|nr:protein kinase, Atypical group [Reticulomyxa filosa]|eukprot:ETO28607.1 protein kinase, Atypical group [Reticulomyxa filosa]